MRRRLGGGGSSRTVVKPKETVDRTAVEDLFEKYADEEELMTMEAIATLAGDLDIDASSDARCFTGVRLLALCWRLGAAKPSEVSKAEWVEGCERLGVDSIEKLRAYTLALAPHDLDTRSFRNFFKFVFLFSRESTHRTIEKDLVCALLPIAIGDRSPHTAPFLEFLAADEKTKRVTLDQWTSFLEFSDKIGVDFSGYDADASAWPLLFDDYVEARTEAAEKKATSTKK